MANLLATFRLVDQMSAQLDNIANSGTVAIRQWENAGRTANTAFGTATASATETAQAIDNTTTSIGEHTNATRRQEEAIEQLSRQQEQTSEELRRQHEISERHARQQEETAVRTARRREEVTAAIAEQTRATRRQEDATERLLRRQEDAAERATQRAEEEAERLRRLTENTQNTAVKIAAATAVVAVGLKVVYDALNECSEAAAIFETAIAKVATVADDTVATVEMSSSILNLSNNMGMAADGLSEATYQAISASVSTASAVAFVGSANKLAVGGFTDATTAVDVLTTALNAYGLEGTDANKISDMLIMTQNKGKTTVDQLASSVGAVIPLAAAYNVEMANLSTTYAVMTAKGVATAEAGTYIKSMLSELGDSGSQVASVLQNETGLSFALLMEQGYSLGDVLDVLGDSVDSDATKFNELWSSTEAGIGALNVFGSGAEHFNDILGQMENSAGATAKAYDTMSNTTQFSFDKMTNAADNLQIKIGSQLNPVLKEVYDIGSSAFVWMGDVVEENPAVVAGLTAVFTAIGATTIGVLS